eukprot:11178120-Lingulodinium_polyedra.AAC.1
MQTQGQRARANKEAWLIWHSAAVTTVRAGSAPGCSLQQVVSHACAESGYLPNLVQEVLLMAYDGALVGRELL